MYEKDFKDFRDYDRRRRIRWDFLEDEISKDSIRWTASERNRENISQQIQTHQSVSSSTHARALIRVISESKSHRDRKRDSEAKKDVRNLQRLREIDLQSLIWILYQLHLYHDLLLRKNQSRSARDYVVVLWESTFINSSLRVTKNRSISRYRDTHSHHHQLVVKFVWLNHSEEFLSSILQFSDRLYLETSKTITIFNLDTSHNIDQQIRDIREVQ
jgi:hypothetical protein